MEGCFEIWQPLPWVLAACSSSLWDFVPVFCQNLSWVISNGRERSGVRAGIAPWLVSAFLPALSPLKKRTLLEAPFSHVLLYPAPWRSRGRKATIRRMKAEPCPNTLPSLGLSPALGRWRRGAGAGSRAVGASLCSSHPAALPQPRIPGDNPSSPAPAPSTSCTRRAGGRRWLFHVSPGRGREEALEQLCSCLVSPQPAARCYLARPSRSGPLGNGVARSLSHLPGTCCPARGRAGSCSVLPRLGGAQGWGPDAFPVRASHLQGLPFRPFAGSLAAARAACGFGRIAKRVTSCVALEL